MLPRESERVGRYLVPYLRLFPIWRFGPIYDPIDGHYIRDGWTPDPFGTWEASSLDEAKRIAESKRGASA